MSIIEEVPGVNNAVQKLQELGGRMRSDDFGFKENDISNLDKIIEALNELEKERKIMREKLETETIKASVLRHDLKVLPGIIREEIMVAVNAARQSNTDALEDLQAELDKMNNNMAELETKARELERENAVLHPERELLRQQHEEIISQLNQKMADKATMQIALNETRDKVRQANQDIVDLEDGILQLKEDLIQERTEARHEKKRLKKAVTDTQTKTKEQKEQNVEKKRELDTHQERLVDSESRLDSIRKSVRRYETSKNKLEADERALSAQLSKQLKLNEALRRRGADIVNENLKEQQEFETMQRQLNNKVKQYEVDIVKETERSSRLDQKRIQLHCDLKDKERLQEEDALYVQELDEQLQSVKRNLTEKAEDVGRMQTENVEMTEEIEALSESHKAVLAQLNKQIEEYREQLSKERKERLELQEVKDEIGKSLDDIKTSQQQFISNISEGIQDGKKKHVQLSNEGVQLQKDIREDEAVIDKLDQDLQGVQEKYEQMFSAMQTKVDNIEGGILFMEKDIITKKATIAERTPIFEELEVFFNKRSEEYDTMKKSIVALKNKKMGLEDAIKRAKKERDGLKAPQETLKSDLKSHRGQVMRQLKKQGTDTQKIEQEIFLAGCQLRLVMEENQKFEDACKKVEDDLADLETQRMENEKIKMMAQGDLQRQKSELTRKWQADNMMQEFFASRDEATAEAFGRLLDKTEKRETKIDEITGKLRGELEVLSEFLDNLSTRRPEVSESARSKKRPGSLHSAIGTVANANKHSSLPDSSSRLASRMSQAKSLDPRLSPDTVRTPKSLRFDLKSEAGSVVSKKSRTTRSPLQKFVPPASTTLEATPRSQGGKSPN
ncbi:myosin-11 isoform X2 [Aplysia californica]|uniref:Myosin-11 isoform X2 n=1 Tax=Aplysia californica TaxID=6500 RepID=A0ABM0JPP2_APLCA|nr:myosin-11 isoform X2 [Aplysia californica]